MERINDSVYNIHIWLAMVFGIDQDIVQVYNNKNIKLLGKDFINIALKAGKNIKESKKHDMVLKMAISSLKNRLLFIAFTNSILVMSTS